jgi:CTP:molybdopterin cytidylyltransferase MocA
MQESAAPPTHPHATAVILAAGLGTRMKSRFSAASPWS